MEIKALVPLDETHKALIEVFFHCGILLKMYSHFS